ncbi:MAG: rhodanese-like domain-containing protein [Verrucomicrobia bacterium]|nr:rhodanese-like domain-containing protein [Verrucomicrobiota bacterium]
MHLHQFLWLLALTGAFVLLGLGAEAVWDWILFQPGPGRVCANLNARQARVWLSTHPETQVLDVRSAREFAGGALPGAHHLPSGDPAFDQLAGALDRGKPVLVYCAGGYRSRKAVTRLKELGFTNIQHLHRGYLSWPASGKTGTGSTTSPTSSEPSP